ncbi:unnamed protein product [Eruca vesicaria subsp. sativa]|uniref:Uncharacterized protein n=1 Tax=Eruca vesicaria subsp. sativa TaxID=29727 RepID=A0ABC8JMW3_ERUVS|nr:unnamed protein product [Eruca vesicaria subsp. sativa]
MGHIQQGPYNFISMINHFGATLFFSIFPQPSTKPIFLNRKMMALAAPETLTSETVTDVSDTQQPKQPRKDAWEELKSTLETKPWISQKKMIILLNQATDIINLWQQSGGNLTSQ